MSFIDKNLKVGVEKLDEGQAQLVKQLENLVDDSSIDVIGLEGEWGSGKSTILKALEDTSKYNCYTYDLWAHQEDNLRYSFLRGLLERFEYFLLEDDKFKTFRNDVDDLISAKKESDSPKINHKMVSLIFVMLLLPIFSNIAQNLWSNENIVFVAANLFFPIAVVSLLYLWNNNKSKTKTKIYIGVVVFLLFVFIVVDVGLFIKWTEAASYVLITQIVCFISFFVFLYKIIKHSSKYANSSFVQDALTMYNGDLVEKTYSMDVQPRMEDVRFFMGRFFSEINKNEGKKLVEENEEKKVIKRNEGKRIIIIFDNLDRLPANKIRDFWTFLQTFFVEKKYKSVTTIVAYERKTVENAWEDGVGSAYLEKSLNYTLYVPLCSRMDLKKFFEQLYEQIFKDEKKQTIDNLFNMFHLLKNEQFHVLSRRAFIDIMNELAATREKMFILFQEKKVDGYFEYPLELAAMYVLRKSKINDLFSKTIQRHSVEYYINAYDDCSEWVSQFIPGKGVEEKKMCLQRIFNRIIQNNNQSANNMQSYYLADHFRSGKLEQFFKYVADSNGELEADFDYIFFVALQGIKDDGVEISDIVSSLLYCQRNKIMSDEYLKHKWIVLFNKMESLKMQPQKAWAWNVIVYYTKDYLKESIDKDSYMFIEPREYFFVEKLRSYYSSKDNMLEGKICLSEKYLDIYSFNSLPKHSKDLDKEGKNFFYTNEKDDESIVVEQLNEFTQEDWELSLKNFWNPGVLQYLNLKNKPNRPPKNLQESLKFYFEHIGYNTIKTMNCVQKGPCSDDEYFEKWFELIKILKPKGESELKEDIKENVRKFFPEKYRTKVDKIIQNKKV